MIVNPKSSFVSIDSFKNYDDYIHLNDANANDDIRDFQFDGINIDKNLINNQKLDKNQVKDFILKEHVEAFESTNTQNKRNTQMIFDKYIQGTEIRALNPNNSNNLLSSSNLSMNQNVKLDPDRH